MRDRPPTGRDGRDRKGTYRTRIEIESAEFGPELLRVVASVDNTSLSDLPILSDSLDPDAIAAVLASAQTPVSITFMYHDYRVTVSTDGGISLKALETPV